MKNNNTTMGIEMIKMTLLCNRKLFKKCKKDSYKKSILMQIS
ncbi:hypothetical protein BN341_11600 [Helicobacter heilmannii ASB1.4]|nr:hypothetical protein BN341_11600 [Helicobacter heilmannii ASB1.4]